jgi:hypothetical protein
MKFIWTIPIGYWSKNPKSNFAQILQASPQGFQRKDRYYILVKNIFEYLIQCLKGNRIVT